MVGSLPVAHHVTEFFLPCHPDYGNGESSVRQNCVNLLLRFRVGCKRSRTSSCLTHSCDVFVAFQVRFHLR